MIFFFFFTRKQIQTQMYGWSDGFIYVFILHVTKQKINKKNSNLLIMRQLSIFWPLPMKNLSAMLNSTFIALNVCVLIKY